MLSTIVKTHRPQLRQIAEAWLATGAMAFSIWENNRPLASWPNSIAPTSITIAEPIYLNGIPIGELRVAGARSDNCRLRLRTDASLIAQLTQLATYLSTITNELVDTQDQLLAIYDLTQATRSQVDLQVVMNTLVHKACNLMKVDGAFLMVQPPNQEAVIAHHRNAMVDERTLKYSLKSIQETGHEFVLEQEDVKEQSAIFRNYLLIPINVHGVNQAALGLVNKLVGDFLSPDIKLARAIADYIGASIENILLHRQSLEQAKLQTEVELAQRVQMNLLPRKLPQVAGLELWANSRPAFQVGGDFYDFAHQPGRPFTFAVGDISGKGLSAALLMAMTRTAIRMVGLKETTPEAVLELSNEDLYNDFTEVNMFATVFYGQFDNENRELVYANAGHSPVIYYPVGGRPHLLEADSTALGILPLNQPVNQRIPFAPGDVLVVATDGFNEAHNQHDQLFGYERLMEEVESLATGSPQEIVEGLYTAVNNFSSGHPQDDDQTLMVLKGTEA